MLFSVIYEVDIPRSKHPLDRQHEELLTWYRPPKHRTRWDLTECSDWDLDVDGETPYKHRKWVALLTKAQFLEFLDGVYIQAEDVETMGSLGAPGLGLGVSPAIAYNGSGDHGVYQCAYVTPIPQPVGWPEDKGFSERDWRRVRAAIFGK